ncbi:MAG TPA: cupin domain-containing protein [Marmoricola sp.]|jgi:quercetin dioxygenase-like cupin family protein|nr:cupin domain-containing protein [Marmoricola sp.]
MTESTYVTGLIGMLEPFPDKPRAQNVMKAPEAHVVAFAFGSGQELHEHTAHHPVLIQALDGHLTLSYDGRELDLRPGDLLHLPAMLPHSVVAHEDSTLTVTMLLTP